MSKYKLIFFCLPLIVILNWLYLYTALKCDGDGRCIWPLSSIHSNTIQLGIQAQNAGNTKDGSIKDWWLPPEATNSDCKPPILNPFDSRMTHIFKNNKKVNCSKQSKKYYFKVDYRKEDKPTPEILRVEPLPNNMSCCYTSLNFADSGDYNLLGDAESERCTFIMGKWTKVPEGSQVVLIKCWYFTNITFPVPIDDNSSESYPTMTMTFSHKELLIFVPNPSKSLRKSKTELLKKGKDGIHSKLNIIILGFDQVSRLGFIRQMRRSFKYLTTKLEAIDLQGFNKVGDATLNNTLAFLTGKDFGAVIKNELWWNGNSTYFDNLPWIWKNYSELGYITSWADDFVSVFNYRFKGFKQKPTDYYFHPIINWLRRQDRMKQFSTSTLCFGRKVIFDMMQDYATMTSVTLRNDPYFQFVWNSAIHKHPINPSLADDGLYSTLQHFKASGLLNTSLVVLLSDHGWRAGSIMNLSQARIENKMTFSFLLLPNWFKTVYPKAYENVLENQYRLTTPYDIHSTLLDLLNPEENLNNDAISKTLSGERTHPFGISLFRPIPKGRTCEAAGIDETWCTCTSYTDIFVGGGEVKKLARFAVDTMNSWLEPFQSCHKYILQQVLSAQVKVVSKNIDLSKTNTFRIVFSVSSNGIKLSSKKVPTFEVVVFTKDGWLDTKNVFTNERMFMTMSTEVFRISTYGKESCMEIYALKKICTCK